MTERSLHLVFSGNAFAGKSSFIERFLDPSVTPADEMTEADYWDYQSEPVHYNKQLEVDGATIHLNITEIPGSRGRMSNHWDVAEASRKANVAVHMINGKHLYEPKYAALGAVYLARLLKDEKIPVVAIVTNCNNMKSNITISAIEQHFAKKPEGLNIPVFFTDSRDMDNQAEIMAQLVRVGLNHRITPMATPQLKPKGFAAQIKALFAKLSPASKKAAAAAAAAPAPAAPVQSDEKMEEKVEESQETAADTEKPASQMVAVDIHLGNTAVEATLAAAQPA